MPDREMQLKTGNTGIHLPVPEGAVALTIQEPEHTASMNGFAADLDSFFFSKQLGGCHIAIVVADKTRLSDYDRYLPVLVDRLEAAGVKREGITFFIAYGTHPVQSDEESKNAYGGIFTQYRFVHHDCSYQTLFREIGHTSRGTPILFRKDILETDFLITFGAISHHYFAGFGGGRKLLFPGLGYRDAIYKNHSLFLDRRRRSLCVGCRPGRISGNPLAEDLAEIEAQKPADLAIHSILNSRGNVCQVLVGTGRDHFRQACARHGENCEVKAGKRYDLVVASCGGTPKDINFIQSHKAIHHAADFVKDGGTLILFSRCKDGLGSKTFLPWFQMEDRGVAFDHLIRDYQGNGGTALAMMEKTERISIGLVTDLPGELCETIGVEKMEVSTVIEKMAQFKETIAVIPNASLLVRKGNNKKRIQE